MVGLTNSKQHTRPFASQKEKKYKILRETEVVIRGGFAMGVELLCCTSTTSEFCDSARAERRGVFPALTLDKNFAK